MTLRQLFYRLVSNTIIKNTRGDYQKLSYVMTGAREREEIPFEWIVDRSRPEYTPNAWRNPFEYWTTVSREYRRDYWQEQTCHVEIWTEKDTLTGSIEPVTDELGVTVRVGRGFQSATRANEIAQRFAERNREGKRVEVFYLGDHDPSGRCIEDELRARVKRYGSGPFKMQRLAIHRRDIQKFNLPPLQIKLADSRAVAFYTKHGEQCVEVDALAPSELRRRIRTAVTNIMDAESWNRAVAIEKVEHQSIAAYVAAWPGATPAR